MLPLRPAPAGCSVARQGKLGPQAHVRTGSRQTTHARGLPSGVVHRADLLLQLVKPQLLSPGFAGSHGGPAAHAAPGRRACLRRARAGWVRRLPRGARARETGGPRQPQPWGRASALGPAERARPARCAPLSPARSVQTSSVALQHSATRTRRRARLSNGATSKLP